jgi:8-oxo-dGTP diphosphatase
MSRPVTPPVAADIIIELIDRPGRPVVFIERLNPPHGWALPGGFVDIGETVEAAAVREAREETGLEVELKALLGCYSSPERDPRGHTVSLVYVAEASGEPVACDDARDVRICTPDQPPTPLVFDHPLILKHYLEYRRGQQLPPLGLG